MSNNVDTNSDTSPGEEEELDTTTTAEGGDVPQALPLAPDAVESQTSPELTAEIRACREGCGLTLAPFQQHFVPPTTTEQEQQPIPANVTCDWCNERLQPGENATGCEKCGFDFCAACFGPDAPAARRPDPDSFLYRSADRGAVTIPVAQLRALNVTARERAKHDAVGPDQSIFVVCPECNRPAHGFVKSRPTRSACLRCPCPTTPSAKAIFPCGHMGSCVACGEADLRTGEERYRVWAQQQQEQQSREARINDAVMECVVGQIAPQVEAAGMRAQFQRMPSGTGIGITIVPPSPAAAADEGDGRVVGCKRQDEKKEAKREETPRAPKRRSRAE